MLLDCKALCRLLVLYKSWKIIIIELRIAQSDCNVYGQLAAWSEAFLHLIFLNAGHWFNHCWKIIYSISSPHHAEIVHIIPDWNTSSYILCPKRALTTQRSSFHLAAVCRCFLYVCCQLSLSCSRWDCVPYNAQLCSLIGWHCALGVAARHCAEAVPQAHHPVH